MRDWVSLDDVTGQEAGVEIFTSHDPANHKLLHPGQEKLRIKICIPCIKTRVVEIILFRNNYWYTVLVLGHKIGECMV